MLISLEPSTRWFWVSSCNSKTSRLKTTSSTNLCNGSKITKSTWTPSPTAISMTTLVTRSRKNSYLEASRLLSAKTTNSVPFYLFRLYWEILYVQNERWFLDSNQQIFRRLPWDSPSIVHLLLRIQRTWTSNIGSPLSGPGGPEKKHRLFRV